MTKDLDPILEDWDYRPGKVTARKIIGLDGKEKIQMRLYLGALQMEASGRPDGCRPHGYESLLDYFQAIARRFREEGREDEFELTPGDCAEIREEAMSYYYRYLGLFQLEDYAGVARDTERNLKVFDLVKDHARTDADKYALEQYRPYVIMMSARARQNIALDRNDFGAAYAILQKGMDAIRRFFDDYEPPGLAEKSEEFKILAVQAEQLRKRLPRNPLDVLREKLDTAVSEERFEEAARLRDKIRQLEESHPR
jgi:hypothetical protein